MPTSDELRTLILETVQAPGYRPIRPKGFARALRLHEDDKPLVRKAIRRLIAEGKLAYGERHLVYETGKRPTTMQDIIPPRDKSDDASTVPRRASAARRGEKPVWDAEKSAQRELRDRLRGERVIGDAIVGTFTRKASGIGFVRQKFADPFAVAPDIFIPAHATSDAATGDTVAVEMLQDRDDAPRHSDTKKHSDTKWKKYTKNRYGENHSKQHGAAEEEVPRRRGRVVKVLQRAADRFVGTYFEERGRGYVAVDAGKFTEPLHVGDPSASPAKDGDKVVVELTSYPTSRHRGEAVIVEVLGEHGVPGVDTLLIMREYSLPEQFSEPALKAARQAVQDYFKLFPDDAENPTIPDDRFDATGETIVTIDPFDARDFDDAISLIHNADGSWRLGVHIADVAFFVPQGGEIDRDARDRSTSVYLPDRVIPMLPEVISNSLASLQPGKMRLAKSVYLDFTPDGLRTQTEIKQSVIRSTRRLNYDEVQEFLETQSPQTRHEWGNTVSDLILQMAELAAILKARRVRRGAIELAMPEVKIELDSDGKVCGAHNELQRESNSVIEECMLAANEAVATFLADNGVAFMRRVHPVPSLKKMKIFGDFVRAVGLGKISADELVENRFTVQRLLAQVRGTSDEYAVSYALLRSMPRAVYVNADDGHYALAMDCYAHFTSPIRRYPDLTIHRLIDLLLAGKKPKVDEGELLRLADHCSQREQRAEDAERNLVLLKMIDYLSHHIGMRLAGTISGVERYGLFVRGVEFPAEGLIRLETITGDRYRYDRATQSLIGLRDGSTLRLGDKVTVEVVSVDFEQRKINYRLVTA